MSFHILKRAQLITSQIRIKGIRNLKFFDEVKSLKSFSNLFGLVHIMYIKCHPIREAKENKREKNVEYLLILLAY